MPYCLGDFNRLLHIGAGSDPVTCATCRRLGSEILHAWTPMETGRADHQGNKGARSFRAGRKSLQ